MSPVVPRRSPGYVPTAPIPIPRPGNAFQPAPPVDLSGVQRVAESIYQEEQQKADHSAILGADAQLADLSNQLLFDPQNGALTKRGADAAPAHRAAMDAWTKSTSQIAASLSENQRFALEKVAHGRTEDFDRVLFQHAATEMQHAIIDKSEASIDSERALTLQNFAKFGDLPRVQEGIEHQRAAYGVAAGLLGETPEVTTRKIAQEVSRIHQGVLNVMIAKGQDLAASKYFQDHLTDLEPAAIDELQKHVDLASIRGESQRRSDSIFSSTATLSGAIAEAQKIEDPQLRDATEERLSRAYELKAASDRFKRDDAFQRAGQVLRKTGDLNNIAPADWLTLSPEQQIQLRHLDADQRKPNQTGDSDLFMSLMNMSSLSGTRGDFIHTDLTPLKARLSDKQYSQILRRQLTLRDEAERATTKKHSALADSVVRSLMRVPGSAPTVPGAPLRPSAPSDLNLFNGAPSSGKVSPADLEKARRDPGYRQYLKSHGVQVP